MGKPDYFVIIGTHVYIERAIDEVTERVQKYLDRDEGWEPIGGIATMVRNGECYVSQAMFKK